VLAGIFRRQDFAFHPARTKTARHHNAVHIVQALQTNAFFQIGRGNPIHFHIHAGIQRRVLDGFAHAQVSVVQFHVFADQPNPDHRLLAAQLLHHPAPLRQVGFLFGRQVQPFHQDFRNVHFLQHQWDAVKQVGSLQRDDGLNRHIAELRDLGAQSPLHWIVAARHDHIRQDADGAQFAHGVLGGFGFSFFGGFQVRQPGQVHEGGIAAPQVVAHFPDGFQKRLTLNIPDSSTNFNQGNIRVGSLANQRDAPFNFIGDVGNDLNRAAQIVTAPFPVQNFLIDLAGSDRAIVRQAQVAKAFVMPQVQVSLGAVVQNEDFPVLVRAKRSRVDVQIGVQLLNGNVETARLQEPPDCCSGYALTNGREHPAREKDNFSGHPVPPIMPGRI